MLLQNSFEPEDLEEENDADDQEISNDPDPADIVDSGEGIFGYSSANPISEDPHLSPVGLDEPSNVIAHEGPSIPLQY